MKKIKYIFLVLLLAVSFFVIPINGESIHIEDDYGLLTSEEITELETLASEYSIQYNCDINIRVKSDYEEGYYYIEDYSEYLYQSENMGLGTNKDGILLLIVMSDRCYDICTYGNASITDYDRNTIEDNFISYLRDSNYYKAFNNFIKSSAYALRKNNTNTYSNNYSNDYNAYENHEIYEPYETKRQMPDIYIILLVSLILSAIITAFRASAHKTKGRKYEASNYINKAGTRLTGVSDIFLYANETRRRIHHDNDGPGGGHHIGAGPSHGGGGFSHNSGHF